MDWQRLTYRQLCLGARPPEPGPAQERLRPVTFLPAVAGGGALDGLSQPGENTMYVKPLESEETQVPQCCASFRALVLSQEGLLQPDV